MSAPKPYAQALFDARDILLPTGSGKHGQRRRVDCKAILMLLATQGDPKDKDSNGLMWTAERISVTLGIGRDQLRSHLDWLVSVGLVHRKRRMNSSNVLWVDRDVLRDITQRQMDDRAGFKVIIEEQLNDGSLDEDTKVPEWEPEDLEDLYFQTEKEVISEALPEAPAEAHSEALAEALAEASSEADTEARSEAVAEDRPEVTVEEFIVSDDGDLVDVRSMPSWASHSPAMDDFSSFSHHGSSI